MDSSTLASIGFATLLFTSLWVAYSVYRFAILHFLVPRPSLQLQSYRPKSSHKTIDEAKPTAWALVTGASGGIGYGYASHLLTLNFGVIILAEAGIENAVDRLRAAHPDAVIEGITMDCITATPSAIDDLVSNLSDLPVTILINNVGGMPIGFPDLRPFTEYTVEGIDNAMNMNARFATHLTRALLPKLIANAEKLGCRSLILNVTSGARIGLPYLMLYSATKGYNSAFSHTLTRELRYLNKPVDCLLIVPGDVVSDSNRHGVAPGSPSAVEYGRIVLERVDAAVKRGLLEVSPYWVHALQISALEWLPESVKAGELGKVMEGKKRAYEEAYKKEL